LRAFGKGGRILTDFGYADVLGAVCMDLIVAETPRGG